MPATPAPAAPPSVLPPPEPGDLGRWAAWTRPSQAPSPVDPALQATGDLDAVRAHLGDCRRCGLCDARSNIVFGVGDPAARLFIIGEGPGAHEDRQGEPFVGKAGKMLDRMLEAVLGLKREQVYISTVVKCRPPGNRNPSPDEIAQCRPFLDAQLRVVRPDLVLVLGAVAHKTVFGTDEGITASRGSWRELSWVGGSAQAMSTFHPAYLLRQPGDKRLTFADLKELRGALDALPPRS